ncbi:aspartate/glutamate racemase family protein [Pelagibacterium montanilacus]|uniref:aspartate racemase/maleate isomerase family protein n=1 Tax=Pelagibacterium montanilacus TaxID=2185280 RepID=UPI0013DFF176|nr:aspartate/glutamate racemase family protein [Pelagibacterium montanilacus]
MQQGVGTRSGPGAVPLYGAILLASDMTTERDMRALMPAALGSVTTRVPFSNPTTPENLRAILPHLSKAAGLLVPGTDLPAIYFSCTSATVVLGYEVVRAAIGEHRPGVPVVTPLACALEAYALLGADRIAVMSPYVPETTRVVVDHFEASGLEVTNMVSLDIPDDRDMARMADDDIVEACARAVNDRAQALFVSCTALPAARLAPRIEARIGRPVVTSNLAGLWKVRALAGCAPSPELGTLMGLPLNARIPA